MGGRKSCFEIQELRAHLSLDPVMYVLLCHSGSAGLHRVEEAEGSGEEEEGGRHDSHCALAGRGAQGLRGHRSLPIFTTATLYIPCKGQPKKHH